LGEIWSCQRRTARNEKPAWQTRNFCAGIAQTHVQTGSGESSGRLTAAVKAGGGGEQLAAAWLARERGFAIVARNWRSPRDRRDELDLVGRDGEALVFVEVKTRAAGALVPGYYAVDARKNASPPRRGGLPARPARKAGDGALRHRRGRNAGSRFVARARGAALRKHSAVSEKFSGLKVARRCDLHFPCLGTAPRKFFLFSWPTPSVIRFCTGSASTAAHRRRSS